MVDNELKSQIKRIEWENSNLKQEKDQIMGQLEQLQKQNNMITMLVKKSNSNSTNRSNDDTMDLQQYIESKKDSTIYNQINN